MFLLVRIFQTETLSPFLRRSGKRLPLRIASRSVLALLAGILTLLPPVVLAQADDPALTVNICDRTEQVRSRILLKVSATDCTDVSTSELAAITTLSATSNGVLSLRAGDFAGLTGLKKLYLARNHLIGLPADIFAELSSLTELDLASNQLISLPAGLFDALSSLGKLNLSNNPDLSYSPYLLSPLTSLTQLNGTAYTSPAPPGAPTGLTAAFIDEHIALSWTSPATGTPTSYRILRQAGTDPQAVYVADTYAAHRDAVTYTDTGVTAGETYTYQIQALNAGGASAGSNLAVAVVDICGRTESVRTTILAVVTATDCALVSISELAAITSLDLSGASITTLQAGDFAGMTGVTTLDLPDDLDASAYSPYLLSSLTSLTQFNGASYTPPTPPGAPTGLTATFTDGHIALRWTAPATGIPSSYRILRQPVVIATDCALVSPNKLAAITNLELGNGYLHSLRSRDFAGMTGLMRLDLHGNRITRLPAGVFDELPNLTYLNLDATNLMALPAGVFDKLTKLTTLDLCANELRTLPAGIFDKLTELTTLELYLNDLRTLPAGIFDHLPNLTKLYLYRNELTSLRAGVFDKLTNLSSLLLHENDLTSLPAGIFDALANLTELNLAENDLTSLPAGIFDELSNLTELNLVDNVGLSYSPYLLSPLTSLTRLSYAHYTRPAPPGAPTDLMATVRAAGIHLSWTAPATGTPTSYRILRQAGTDPQEVYVADTYDTGGTAVTYTDTGVTAGETYTYQVQALNAGGASAGSNEAEATMSSVANICDRTGPVLTAILAQVSGTACGRVLTSQLAALTSLDLSGASIVALQASDFAGLSGLTSLDLSDNTLGVLPPGVFDPLSSLTTLDLSNNTLGTLPPGVFDSLSSLTTLDLSDNALAALPAGVFDALASLTTLNLANNSALSYSPKVLSPLTSLTRLNGESYTPPAPSNAPTDLTATITTGGIALHWTAPTTGLVTSYRLLRQEGASPQEVYVADTYDAGGAAVTYTDADITVGETYRYQVQALNAGGASPESNEAVVALTAVVDLCDRTEPVQTAVVEAVHTITCAPFSAVKLAAISILDLSGQHIRALRANDFAGMSGLTVLNLRETDVESLEAGVFDPLPDLITLDLHGNQLESLPGGVFDVLSQLTTLRLSNNLLRGLPAGVFDYLSALTTLDLSNNNLSALPPGVFDHLSSLTTLDLSNNALTALPAGLFDALSNLTTLDLSNNTLTALPVGIFDVLSNLTTLRLNNNPDLSYSPEVLSRLTRLTRLNGAPYTPPALPSAPTNLTATITSGGIALHWMVPTTGVATSYRILRHAGTGPQEVYVADTYATGRAAVTYTDADITAGETYRYQVQALNAGGASPPSNEAVLTATNAIFRITSVGPFTVQEGTTAVATLTASVSSTSSNSLTWSIPSGPAGGADGHAFSLSSSGSLTFRAAKDFEAPDDADTDGTYEVTVQVGGDAQAALAEATLRVTLDNVDEPAVITLSTTQPQVGRALTATLTDPDGTVSGITWAWTSSADHTSWTPIPGADSAVYTPQVTDLGHYLRVTASYIDDVFGAGRSAPAVLTDIVQVAPVRRPPGGGGGGGGGGNGGGGPACTQDDVHGNTAAQATVIALDTLTAGAICPAADVDYFTATIPERGLVFVETTGTGPLRGTILQDGVVWASGPIGGRQARGRLGVLVQAGPVVVAVQGQGGATGAYTLVVTFVRGTLENPRPASFQSGVGVLSGWVCEAEEVEIEIVGAGRQEAAYGTERLDTAGVCGDTNNGFGLLFNWNLLGGGEYEVVVFVDGLVLGWATVTVTTLGEEFLRDVPGECMVADFPSAGETVRLVWQEAQQNFVLAEGSAPTEASRSGMAGVGFLENPSANSFQSGIGVISGWVCAADEVMITIGDLAPQMAGYGTERLDTQEDCGDTDNGFGLLFNWNLLGDGEHEVIATVDGTELARTTVRVTTLGEEFVRDAVGECTVADFPHPGETVTLTWQESSQNFVITEIE